jgi:predicted TIM-barrel fold metal-dependent hydrolase
MAREYDCVSADSHLDIFPSRWASRIPLKYREQGPKDPVGFVTDEGRAVAPFEGLGRPVYAEPIELGPGFDDLPGTGSPAQRLRELEIDGVDAEIIFPGALGPANWRAAAKDDAAYRAVVRAYNEHMWEEYCVGAPDRLLGLGVIPVTGVDDAVAEMEYCARNGLVGVALNSFPSGLSHPSHEDDRFWAAAVDLRCPVTVHVEFSYPTATAVPSGVSPRSYGGGAPGPAFIYPKHPERGFNDIILRYAKYGFRGALHAVQLVWAGVFDRFPALRVYFAETQIGWIPNFYELMDQHYLRHQYWADHLLGLKPLKQLPSDYVKEHCYWGFVYNPVGVRTMAREVGVDRIMWATDFPHAESDWPHSQRVISESMGELSEGDRNKVIAGNAVGFFRLNA